LKLGCADIVSMEILEYVGHREHELIHVPVGGICKEYDGISQKTNTLYEIKLDSKAMNTGNLAIEIACNGKPSGITATTSQVWITAVPKTINSSTIICYEFFVSYLRTAIRGMHAIKAGDGKRSEIILLPLSLASRIANSVYPMTINFDSYKKYW